MEMLFKYCENFDIDFIEGNQYDISIDKSKVCVILSHDKNLPLSRYENNKIISCLVELPSINVRYECKVKVDNFPVFYINISKTLRDFKINKILNEH